MKKTSIWAMVLVGIIVCAFTVSGCGKSEGPAGPTGEAKPAAEQAKPAAEGAAPTDAELGVPMYAGAKFVKTTKTDLRATGGDSVVYRYDYTTPDAFAKVVDFYKANLKDAKPEEAKGPQMQKAMNFNIDDKTSTIVSATDEGANGTNISVVKNVK